ncbi:protein of unknown function DUF752 [Desulfurispirillum indicum S5]|uniref:MnmC-like methyltransferase domain-containing protein n=2 Tax=Desulfurispirillum TaxID=393029 RepID=E6W316_DESIS|nr:MnmC family methyltransferase [Desulfurispirillum indicum]ADU65677.1 protein of unknown function DUF752 [Desulfurispirillum indicum S5]
MQQHTTAAPSADGTFTRYSPFFDEHYHSTRDGAWLESLQKHVLPGLQLSHALERPRIRVLDICFGLGLNSLATLWYLEQQQYQGHVHIIAPEFDRELIASLPAHPYPQHLNHYRPLIEELSRTLCHTSQRCQVEILPGDALQSLPRLDHGSIDIVYQDPFSPAKNPELWTREYFALIAALMKDTGLLTTYSQATPVRMGLSENGFLIYDFHNQQPGIRRSTIASRIPLQDMTPIDMERKKERSPLARSYRDPGLTGNRLEILQRFQTSSG